MLDNIANQAESSRKKWIIGLVSLALFIALTVIISINRRSIDATVSNISVTNNSQIVFLEQSATATVIARTSIVEVNNPAATNGYELTARISLDNYPLSPAFGGTGLVEIYPNTTDDADPATCPTGPSPTGLVTLTDIDQTLFTTANNTSTTTYFCIRITIPADATIGNYTLDIFYDEVPNAIMATNGTIMQTVTNATCPTITAPINISNPAASGLVWVVDARDNRTYWIGKIPNSGGVGIDLCWMLTNLAYAGGTSNGGVSTYGDTMSLTLQTTGTGMGNADARYIAPTPPTSAPSFTSCNGPTPGTGTCTPPTTGTAAATGTNGAQYGYLYNWCAAMGGATANSNACNTTSTTGFTSASICPYGWRLPTGQATTGEFTYLNTAINGGSTTDPSGLLNNWLGVYAGLFHTSGSFVNVGTLAYYWSSTVSNATNAYTLHFFSGAVDPASSRNKDYGFAVRCVR
jgi:uncharacterized protein (TIGR02145 family)